MDTAPNGFSSWTIDSFSTARKFIAFINCLAFKPILVSTSHYGFIFLLEKKKREKRK